MEISLNPNLLIGGLLVLTILAVLIWLGWGRQPWMAKLATVAVRGIVVLVSAMVLVGTIWVGWECRPFMPAGRTLHLISERIGDHEFQVWQRKNRGFSEPFASGLFVRKQSGGPWKVFLLDFEDTYRPAIVLRREGSRIGVFYGSEEWGYFDEAQQQAFRRYYADGTYHARTPDMVDSEPPGDWWLKQSGAGK